MGRGAHLHAVIGFSLCPGPRTSTGIFLPSSLGEVEDHQRLYACSSLKKLQRVGM